jgi:LacI family transcriptional regulator
LVDVAKRANVSVSTVSEVLRGRSNSWISNDTRQRVLAAAQALDYRPNHLAKSLRRQSTRMLGLLFPGMTNDYVTSQVEAIYERCRLDGWRVLLSPLATRDEADHAEAVQVLLEMQVEGLFILSPYRPWVPPSAAMGIPVVLVDTHCEARPLQRCARVVVDRATGVTQAVAHLLATGKRRIRPIMDVEDPTDGRARAGMDKLNGWRAAYRAAGLGVPEELLLTVPFGEATIDAGIALGKRLLNDPQMASTDGILCCDDMLAIGITQVLSESGRRVPDEVAVVGFADQRACVVPPIRLASIGVPIDQVAAMAVQQMSKLREATGDASSPDDLHVAAQFVLRASAGAAADSK